MRLRAEAASLGRPNRLTSSSVYLMLVAGAVVLVLPLLWMISSSLKPEFEIFAYPPSLLPSEPLMGNYREVFTRAPFGRQYFNSLYIGALNVVGTLVVSSCAGYAFARVRFPGRNVLFVAFLSALLLPSEVTIVPLYGLMTWLGWTGTHLPLIVEPILGAAAVVGTFVMRQYFLALPRELEEAAYIDGLGMFGAFWRVALPLARPALATVAVLTFLSSWNLFLEPLVYTGGDHTLWTVPIALNQYTNFDGTPIFNLQMAATTLSILPVAAVFIVAQRHIVAGIANTGVKG